MKVCKHCGEINPGDSAFCCNCGNTNFIYQEEITCPRCGAVNDKSFVFCIECGGELTVKRADDSDVPSYADAQAVDLRGVSDEVADLYGNGAVTPSETSQCPHCGAPVPLTSIFCNRCGASVADLHEHRVVQRKVCPQCGRPNPLESHFCSYCFCSLADAEIEDMQVAHESRYLGDVTVRQVMLESPSGKKVLCPNCGTLNDKTEDFCDGCGLKLAVEEPKSYCPNCGAENPVDSVFCTKCRHSFGNAEPDSIDKWTCDCGYANDKEDKFCSKCGKKRKK